MDRRHPNTSPRTLEWLGLIIVVGLAAAPTAPAAEKSLTVVLMAEVGLERYLPPLTRCPKRDSLFIGERLSRDAFEKWLSKATAEISSLLFGEANRLRTEVMTFSLVDIQSALQKMKPDEPLFGVTPYRKVAQYLAFLGDVERHDKERLKLQREYRTATLEKWCNFSPTIKDPTLSRAAWAGEIVRKARMAEYFDLVAWYLRVRVKRVSEDSELFVPALLHPVSVWDFETAQAAQAASQSIAEALRGGGDLPAVAKNLVAKASTAGGKTISDAAVEVPGRATYDSSFLRKRRLGLYVAGYIDEEEARRSLIHELGHYVGLPHVFTDDKSTTDRCASDRVNGSFLEAFDKPDAKRKNLCECFFMSRGNREVFADYDGALAPIFDTPLAIIKRTQTVEGKGFEPVRYMAQCANETVSKKYKDYFDGKLDNARANVMTYVSSQESGSIADRQKVTDDQRKVAIDILKTFK